MRPSDPDTCRRALREIGEIAAVAALENSRMTDQEALQTMSAIAGWVMETAPGAGADCGDVIRWISALTSGADLQALEDRAALDLFARMLEALVKDRSADTADTAGPGGEGTGDWPGATRSASGG